VGTILTAQSPHGVAFKSQSTNKTDTHTDRQTHRHMKPNANALPSAFTAGNDTA